MKLRYSFLLSLIAITTVLAGCGEDKKPPADADAAVEPRDCDGDNSRFFVVQKLAIPSEEKDGDETTVVGFNLDNTDKLVCDCANSKDDNACNDYVSPDGEKGIDIQFARLNKAVGSILMFSENITKNIKEGDLLLLVDVQGIDADDVTSSTNDDCVNADIYLGVVPGGGAPSLDGDDLITAGQTFDVDMRSVMNGKPLVRLEGKLANGILTAGPATIPFSLPISGASIEVNIKQGHVVADLTGENLEAGMIGGVLDVEETVEAVVAIPAYSDLGGTLRPVLKSFADSNPDGKMCTGVSAALTFTAIPAVRGEVVTKPTGPAEDGGADDAGDDGGN